MGHEFVKSGLTGDDRQQAERIAELIKPLRAKPGSKANLAKNFGLGYKAAYVKKHAKA